MREKRFWEQRVPVREEVKARVYRCPVCNVLLFSVPQAIPIPTSKTEVVCANGHKVAVPKYEDNQML